MSKRLTIEFDCGLAEWHLGSWSGYVPTSIGVERSHGRFDYVDYMDEEGTITHFNSWDSFCNHLEVLYGNGNFHIYETSTIKHDVDGRNGYRYETITSYRVTTE